jgi:peptidase M50B-like protein
MGGQPQSAVLSRFAKRSIRAGAGILLLALVASVLWDLLHSGTDTSTADALFALILLPAAWTAGRNFRRCSGSERARSVWLLVGIALALVVALTVAHAWYQLPVLPLGDLPVWPILLAAAVACHEAGHAAAAQLLGLSWKPFARFPWAAGIAIRVPDGGLPPRHDLLVALAGPLGSFALAAVAFPLIPELGALSAILGVLNLVPFLRGSDGWRAIQAARQVG